MTHWTSCTGVLGLGESHWQAEFTLGWEKGGWPLGWLSFQMPWCKGLKFCSKLKWQVALILPCSSMRFSFNYFIFVSVSKVAFFFFFNILSPSSPVEFEGKVCLVPLVDFPLIVSAMTFSLFFISFLSSRHLVVSPPLDIVPTILLVIVGFNICFNLMDSGKGRERNLVHLPN